MSTENQYQLQVLIASGEDNLEKAVLGLAFALGAASSGEKVVIFFTMGGAVWADESKGNHKPINGFETIEEYMKLLEEVGATLEGCTSCVENHCAEHGGSTKCKIRKNIVLAGLSSASIRAINTQTIVF